MAISSNSTLDLIDVLTSTIAGNEFASAVQNGSVLSTYTYNRLVIAMSDRFVAADIQAAMLGKQALSIKDIRYMVDAFGSAAIAANVIANVAGGITPAAFKVLTSLMPITPNPLLTATLPPKNVSMPSAFVLTVTPVGNTAAQQVQLNLPAGSTFPSTGAGSSFQLFSAGNANMYTVWYNVSGGSNTNPTPAGFTGIEVTILSSDSNATVAAKTQTAINGFLAGMTSTVATNVVTVIINAVLSQCATPTFSPIAGTYSSAQLVTLSSATSGATIYYTLDGSTPTTSSTLYVGPFSVGVTETVKALAVQTGFSNSAVGSAAYTISASPGVATQAVFTTQPVGAAQGVLFATMPVVTIKDSTNATVTTGPDSTALVTLAISTGTGTLAGTVSMNAVAGVANFAGKGLSINLAGAKILSATKSATSATGILIGYSSMFNISNGLAAINLGGAGAYEILSEAGISNTTGGMITGNIGVSPISHTAITGFTYTPNLAGAHGSAAEVTGNVDAADNASPTPANLTSAVSAMQAAYTDGAGRTSPNYTNLASGNLGGLSLSPGLYKWTSGVTIPTNVTLNGGPSDVYIMQISGTLMQSASASIILAGGLLASNIFWVVAGAVTLGANAVFQGVILGQTSIAVQTMAAVHGALYAQTAVTLQDNTVSPT